MSIPVVAARDIVSNLRSVGTRSKGERFMCPEGLAYQLRDAGEVTIPGGLARPKAERASPAGPTVQPQSSSQADRASRTGKSKR